MNNQQEKKPVSKKKQILIGVFAVATISCVLIFSYLTLSKLKEDEKAKELNQEQFAGTAQVSEQLQSECQKSIEKISTLKDADNQFNEFKINVDNCREVYFNTEGNSNIRTEGMYPDIIVDIAMLAAKTNRNRALEILNFAKGLSPWEFYMGPIVCNSSTTIDAFVESISQKEEKICFNPKTEREKLFAEMKNKNFSILAKTLNYDHVVLVGSPESEEGCPEKISTITKIIQGATSGNLDIEEDKTQSSDDSGMNIVFKTKTDDKLILEFYPQNNCLQLQSVLIPNLPTNE